MSRPTIDRLLSLPPVALRCYTALVLAEGSGVEFRIRRRDLAERLGRATRTISDGLSALVTAGLVVRTCRGRYVVVKGARP